LKTFRYRAYGTIGKSIEEGKLEAESRVEAARLLARRGIQPFQLLEDGLPAGRFSLPRYEDGSKINLTRLFQDLDILMTAGFNVDAALTAIIAGTRNRKEAEILDSVLKQLRGGSGVADAFAKVPGLPEDIVPLLESGESSGRLDKVIGAIAGDLAKQEARRTALIEALVYPVFLLVAMAIALGVITFYLVPALMPIFENAEAKKPVILATLAWVNALVTDNRDILIVGGIVVILILFGISRHPAGGRIFIDAMRKVPFLGATMHKRAMTRYLQALALLTGYGVPINQALELGVKACPIRSYHPALAEIRKKVVQGAAFVASLRGAGLLDEASLALLAVGEEANRLPETLDRAAFLIERDTTRRIERMLKVLTPTITVVMGLLIGSLVISVMSAILSINDLAFK
jgi:general secretion pathway protein F